MKRVMVGVAAGFTVAVFAWLLFVKVGPFHRYYYVNSLPGWNTSVGANSMKYDIALGQGCELMSSQTLRCPFWVSL